MEKIPFPLAGTELYRPLNPLLQQIRLLTILPGDSDEEVRCIMNVASLDLEEVHRHSFETISYVWGDAKLRGSIRVNGERVNVPQSSMAALRCMRLTDLERVVWIDAICINQADNSEKSTQVALMSKIYEHGYHNLVFLGDDEDGVAEEVESVIESQAVQTEWQKCYDEVHQHQREGIISPLTQGSLPESLMDLAAVLDSNRALLDKLYVLPWFRRLWVLQEVTLATGNTCFWGEAIMDLDLVLVVAQILLEASEGRPSEGISAAAQMWSERIFFIFDRVRTTFISTALLGELFEVTDPRDRVFAHTSIFRKSGMGMHLVISPLIAPDYSKTTQQVYRDATRHALESSDVDKIYVWEMIQNFSQRDLEDRPTWAIQFGRCWRRAGRPFPQSFECEAFRAGVTGRERRDRDLWYPGMLTILRNHIADPNILTLYVAVVDSVLETTTVWDGSEDAAAISSMVHSVHAMTNSKHEATALVLVAEAGLHREPEEGCFKDVPHLLEGYHVFMRYGPFTDTDPSLIENNEHELEGWCRYWLFFQKAAKHRRFFKTATGLVGCGPQLMREGDVLVVPENGWMPLVLRPVGEQYLYIGSAYVHGVMHGEVFDKDVEWKWVEIR